MKFKEGDIALTAMEYEVWEIFAILCGKSKFGGYVKDFSVLKVFQINPR